MYHSREEIEKKRGQVRYVFGKICKFRGRLFVDGGLDKETQSYPLLTHLASFMVHARSILQYAFKEAKETRKTEKYKEFVSRNEIIGFFKGLRNSEIHDYTINTHTSLKADSPIISHDPETGGVWGKPVSLFVERLEDLDSPKGKNEDFEISASLGRRVPVDDALVENLRAQGKEEIAEAAARGEALYEVQECCGEEDLFALCEWYLNELQRFVDFGVSNGFIT